MELKQLFYFIKTADDKSFSNAAKNLFLTQQALSKAIRNLEDELGVALFNRNHGGLELTEYGTLLYQGAEQILREVDGLEEKINKLRKKLNKKVSIAISFGVLSAVSPNIITQFQLSNPGIELNVRDYPDVICENMVLENKCEIACVVGPIREHLFKSNLLFSEELNLLINRENELADVKNITIEHLRHQEYLLGTDDFNISRSFKHLCKQYGFNPKINFVSNEMSLLEKLVHLNKGITLIPDHDASNLVYPNICTKKISKDYIDWKVYLIRKKGQIYPESVTILWDFLIQNFNRYILEF